MGSGEACCILARALVEATNEWGVAIPLLSPFPADRQWGSMWSSIQALASNSLEKGRA